MTNKYSGVTEIHNILEPVLGRPSKKESKTTLMSTIRTKTTCVTKVEEMYMWQWKSEHNYLEKE
jgi:hypothetical protein